MCPNPQQANHEAHMELGALVGVLSDLLLQLEALNEHLSKLDLTTTSRGVMVKDKRQNVLTMAEIMERLQIGRQALKSLINKDEDFVTVKLGHRRLMTETALAEFILAKEREERPTMRPLVR